MYWLPVLTVLRTTAGVRKEVMSTSEVMKRITDASPRLKARMAGFLYLLIFITAPSDATTATAGKLIVTLACDTGVALILYQLLRPVSRRLSLLAALFRLVFVVVMAVNSFNYFGLLDLFRNARSAAAFNTGYGIALVLSESLPHDRPPHLQVIFSS